MKHANSTSVVRTTKKFRSYNRSAAVVVVVVVVADTDKRRRRNEFQHHNVCIPDACNQSRIDTASGLNPFLPRICRNESPPVLALAIFWACKSKFETTYFDEYAEFLSLECLSFMSYSQMRLACRSHTFHVDMGYDERGARTAER